MCGENCRVSTATNVRGGSPPRVRGKLKSIGADCAVDGITPACAGKTGKSPKSLITDKDHPRVCGENALVSFQLPGMDGITPACAGKTQSGWQKH